MDNQTRINLIETLIKTLETYRMNTETPSQEQTLTAALQDEISNLMTEQEFTNWIDTGEFDPEKRDVELIKSIIRVYYQAELNSDLVSSELTRQLDKELEKLMTKEEQDLFFTSNEFQSIPWDAV